MNTFFFQSKKYQRFLSAILLMLFTIGVGNVWGGTYKKITSLSDLTTGDYVIVGQKGASSWGRLIYGTPDKSNRLAYTAHYTSSLPTTITTTTADEIWHLTVSGTGASRTVTIYNAGQEKYLKGNGALSFQASSVDWTAEYSSGFRLKCTNYLGVNASANYWRDYALSTLYGGTSGGGYVITLYKETHTVTYNANGGSGTLTDSNSPYLLGTTVTVKSNSFTAPSGKEFSKWNTKADGSGTDFAAGATFAISKDTTFYAQWVSSCTSLGSVNGSLFLIRNFPLSCAQVFSPAFFVYCAV